MNLETIAANNKEAVEKAKIFRESSSLDVKRIHNAFFHEHRNKYPYLGFVEISFSDEETFVMYSNHDDIVAQTYFWYGENSYERMSLNEWRKRATSANVIFDIGAFTGLYSLAASAANPKANIHTFEATKRVYARLLSNIQANRLYHKMTLVNKALSDKNGQINFHQYRGEQILGTGASFKVKDIESTSSNEIVETITLDSYVEETKKIPDLIKIDVEEAEEQVLDGMNWILSEHRPDLIIEVAPKTVLNVSKKLESHGYQLYVIDEMSRSLNKLENNSVSQTCNLLAEKSSIQ